MGAGSSNNVRNIRLNESSPEISDSGHKSGKDKLNAQSISEDKSTVDKDAEIETLTKQICESESLRLDLEDKVQALEERLDYADSHNVASEEKTCDETLQAKDNYILKLEKEKKEQELETNKMKQRHRKKIKQLNSQMAEYKQETNFVTMELRDEVNKLKEDNKKLMESPGNASFKPSTSYDSDETPKLPGGEKMKLILELSEQVTEQDDKIAKLEKKLKEKDFIIDELRVKLKNNTQYLKALDESKETNKNAAGDRNNNSVDRYKISANSRQGASSSSKSDDQSKKSVELTRKSAETSKTDVNSLFAVQEEDEDDFDSSADMLKLSSLLQGVTAKNDKARISIDTLEGDLDRPESNQSNKIEERTDSGLGSAGKREKDKRAKNNGSWADWKDASFSMESGLSDSDFEPSHMVQSKVASAPPKLQNGAANPRLKKKSSSLRKRSSQRNDRPPRPGVAFVNKKDDNTSLEGNDHLLSINPFETLISPVEVS